QSDGKILIGGAFTTYNGTTINRIARLNTNGSLDPDFNVGTGAGSTVSSIAVQSDGKILIGGAFTTYNGTARNEFARLNSNGTLDTGFNIGTGPNGMPYAIAIQSDGKIIIGGYYSFTSYNGVARKQIARVNTDGSLDLSFDPGSLITGNFPMIYSAVIQTDGKILIGGYFTISSGSTTNVSIARINSDGTLDSTFNSPAGMGGTIASMALQSDGKILFNGVAGITSNTAKGIFRINTDGTLDPSFNQGTGANNVIGGLSSTYAPVVIQSNGKILLGGIFRNYYSSSPRGSVTGINLDGTLNTNFNSGAGTSGYNSSGYVYAEAVQNDGKLIIGGWFKKYNGIDSNNLARINVDGVLDTSFNIGTGASSQINSIAIQSDGKILIGGAFTTYNGTTINRLARLNTDGSLDAIFNVGSGSSSGTVNSITIQSDGKILIGGTFLNYNGVNRAGLARITTDGSMDLTFNTGVGSGSMPSSSTVVGSVYVVTLQSNGKILVGGYFTTYNGVPRNRIARINTDGTLDNTFFNNPRDGFEVQVKAIVTR
ncbi:MAG: hypothetical protein WCQ47_01545, partial [bacterium]